MKSVFLIFLSACLFVFVFWICLSLIKDFLSFCKKLSKKEEKQETVTVKKKQKELAGKANEDDYIDPF